MIVLLMVLTMVAAVLLAAMLVWFLVKINNHLESIGFGEHSSLAMITWGVRAIETETTAIAPQVTRLNQGLAAAADGLGAIDAGLVAIAGSAAAQKDYR